MQARAAEPNVYHRMSDKQRWKKAAAVAAVEQRICCKAMALVAVQLAAVMPGSPSTCCKPAYSQCRLSCKQALAAACCPKHHSTPLTSSTSTPFSPMRCSACGGAMTTPSEGRMTRPYCRICKRSKIEEEPKTRRAIGEGEGGAVKKQSRPCMLAKAACCMHERSTLQADGSPPAQHGMLAASDCVMHCHTQKARIDHKGAHLHAA